MGACPALIRKGRQDKRKLTFSLTLPSPSLAVSAPNPTDGKTAQVINQKTQNVVASVTRLHSQFLKI